MTQPRPALASGLLIMLGVSLAACTTTPQDAGALTRTLLLVDTHIDVPYRLHTKPADVSVATDTGDFDYPRARTGGLDVAFQSIYIPAEVDEAGDGLALADTLIDGVERMAREHPTAFALATCTSDIDRIRGSGRIALPLGMENGGPIGADVEAFRHLARRGIRYITLAHSKDNSLSDASYDERNTWGGLSPAGRALIPLMNDTGVMIDISHLTDAAAAEAIALSAVPVIASHSSMRRYTPGFGRNMDDETLEALAAKGGVIQINFGSAFLTAAAQSYGPALREATTQFMETNALDPLAPEVATFVASYRKENPYPYATVDDVADHIDHAVRVAGVDHVGIGSDYDGVGDSLPAGLKDVSDYPNLVGVLQQRGYSQADIAAILGGNVMRVWREVETFAAARGTAPECAL